MAIRQLETEPQCMVARSAAADLPPGARSALDAAAAPLSVVDATGRVIYRNRAWPIPPSSDAESSRQPAELAHRFSNLLTVVQGYADLALDLVGRHHPAADCLREVCAASQAAALATADLLASCGEPAMPQAKLGPVAGEHGLAAHVLLVEDEPALRDLACTVLTAAGFDVQAARNGAEALALAQSHPTGFDLLVTDVDMHPVGGRELTERLSQLHPDLPVVLMSGYLADECLRARVLGGRARFVQKPFSPRDLVAAVRAAVQVDMLA